MAAFRNSIFNARKFDQSLTEYTSSLPLFRAALKSGRETLKQHFHKKKNAARLVATHAYLVDQLLIRAWKMHLPRLARKCDMSLVAVGGYGRSELHPASDIDLMLLVKKGSSEEIKDFVEPMIRFLWDMGLEVGHSVRTLKDCVRESKNDITVATNLMEARLIYGDSELFQRMHKLTKPPRIWPSKKFFEAKWQEQIKRHHHFDDTAYNLEPNIKEGPGGLRDIQMIAWVTQRHFNTVSLHDLVKHGFLDEGEYRVLTQGRNFLWRIRCDLHYAAGRREDRLLFEYQRSLARQFGYTNKRGITAVEQFMKRYYRTVKELSLLNEILLQHFQEAILTRGRLKTKNINRRFRSCNEFIDVTSPTVFERTPFAMLELFLILQQQPRLKGVRGRTIRLIRSNVRRIDKNYRKDLACRSLFMEILRQPHGITHELRRMNAYGVLGAYLPAFGRIVGQMQHDLFHVYTVDQHSLFVVRNLRRLTVPEFVHEFPLASKLIANLVKPERLYLAGLFHDIAKGRSGDHSTLGAKEAESSCRLHSLSEYDTRFVSWLVRHHLLMSLTAQHQDISDPEVVLQFAQRVGDQEHLDNLYLLTVADIRGTSPQGWNTWKGRLLSQLYSATTRLLRRGLASPIDIDAHTDDLRKNVLEILKSKEITREQIEKYWETLDNNYFLRYDAQSLAWHAEMITGVDATELPIVSARFHPDVGGSEFLIYAPDSDGLFVTLMGGFDRLNLSIMDARIHTTRNGFALDSFVVLDHAGQPISDARALTQIQEAIREQLQRPRPGRGSRYAHVPRPLKHFPIETRVTFSRSLNGQRTIMEVIAQDRPGLLYQVAMALHHCKVNLNVAKVATYGERVEDVFFLTTLKGAPITDHDQLACLETEIHARLGSGHDDQGKIPGQLSI